MRPQQNYPVVDAEIVDPTHVFATSIALPNDVTIEVTITVPDRVAWQDVGELSEVAQGAAGYARGHILRSHSGSLDDEVPF